jgi:hydrogenase nickel incorporation protein HypA/HybF
VHEVSLVLALLELADDAARREGASRIEVVHVELGALSGVVPEALAFAFAGAKAGTLAEGARLEIHLLPAVAYCVACGREFEVQSDFGVVLCPCCERPSAALRQGYELTLSRLEVV